jgi:phosphoribosylaminoimidazole-succinocarboxamide synthase
MMEPIDDLHSLDSYIPEKDRFSYPAYLRGRAMVVKKVKRVPIECVVRGYIAGSAWEEYSKNGTIFGKSMPEGLKESQELEQPIYTPTTKADTGHDEPIDKESIIKLIGLRIAEEMEAKSMALYKYAREYAYERGIIIADTKFEFGIDGDRLVLIDEIFTPDSSRFWDIDYYKIGESQPSYDKQPVRDWLSNSGWDKKPPAPMLPPDIIEAATKKYVTAYEKITGRSLPDFKA